MESNLSQYPFFKGAGRRKKRRPFPPCCAERLLSQFSPRIFSLAFGYIIEAARTLAANLSLLTIATSKISVSLFSSGMVPTWYFTPSTSCKMRSEGTFLRREANLFCCSSVKSILFLSENLQLYPNRQMAYLKAKGQFSMDTPTPYHQ